MIKLEDFINNEDNEILEHRGRPKKAQAQDQASEETPALKDVEGEKPQVDPVSKNKIKWAVDEPEDNEASDEIDLNSPDNTESLDDLIDKFDTEEDFFIIGKAGWGKTSLIKKLAKKYNKKVITVYLDKAEATDLGGIPVPVKGKTGAVQEKAMPSWAKIMQDEPDQEFLLFFDEMNQAAPDVMNALMPIVLEHEICEVKFDNFFVGAAGNFEDENGAVNELSGPLKSRFKPLITWEVNTERSWKQVFKYLHKKWDKVISKKLVDAFEENADCFENPREIEMKIFQYIHRIKVNGGERNNPTKYLRRLQNLSKDELTRTQESQLSKLADEMFNFVANKGNNDEEQSGRRGRGKDSQQVPKAIKDFVKSAMEKGYASVPQMVDGKEKNVRFGVCKETVAEFIDEDECNAEMLERVISKLEADGLTWKYDKPQDWKKLGFEDPMDDKWNFMVNGKTKINLEEPSQETPKKKEIKRD